MGADSKADLALVAAVLSGEDGATDRCVRHISDTVWTACQLLCNQDGEVRETFEFVMDAISADGFRRLRNYDGRSRLKVYVGLIVRDVLGDRLSSLIREGTRDPWPVFQGFFGSDIRKLIARRLPGAAQVDLREDMYQYICIEFFSGNYQRLRKYDGRGSFSGFVLHTANHLAINFLRGEIGRIRVPAAVLRLPPLEREIFRLVHREGVLPDAAVLAPYIERVFPHAIAVEELAAAIQNVRTAVPDGYGASFEGAGPASRSEEGAAEVPEASILGEQPRSPEEQFLEDESARILEQALSSMRSLVETLPDLERLYVRIALSGPEAIPARQIATLMKLPVDEVHTIRRRVMRRLRDALEQDDAVKTWLASV